MLMLNCDSYLVYPKCIAGIEKFMPKIKATQLQVSLIRNLQKMVGKF